MPILIEVTLNCEVCKATTLGLAKLPHMQIQTPEGQHWFVVSDGRAFCPQHHPKITITSPEVGKSQGGDG